MAALLGDRARRSHGRLFAALGEEQARALAEHAAGNAQIGRRAIGWAVGDLLAEAHEARLRRRAARYPIGGGER